MKRQIEKKRIALYAGLIGLLVFLYFFGFLRPLENLLTKAINPIQSGFYSIGSEIRVRYDERASKGDLLEKIKELENELNELTKKNIDLKILRQENEILREHLRFSIVNESEYVMAEVISRGDGLNMNDRTEIIVLNKGSRDGIYPGLSVVDSSGVLVGKVEDVKDNISKVLLLNNKKCKITASIQGAEGDIHGVVEGELGLTTRMNFIPQSSLVESGDIVITSGLEESIPRGLIVGRVVESEKENNELWQSAIIESSIDLNDLVIVSVLVP